jgi:hypothetical protein
LTPPRRAGARLAVEPAYEGAHHMTSGSRAERLDHAVEQLITGGRPVRDPALDALLETAALVRAALPPIPSGRRFEARLTSRLAHAAAGGPVAGAVGALEAFARRELRHRGRILAAGAVSSAAVGVTVTAVAVWRSRRHGALSTRAGRQ